MFRLLATAARGARSVTLARAPSLRFASAVEVTARAARVEAQVGALGSIPWRNYSTGTALDKLGEDRFDDSVVYSSVSKETWVAFEKTRSEGSRMTKEQENELAEAMRRWAMERGAVNFAHWASPIRGPTNLLKYDAFLDLNFATGEPIVKFTSSRLFLSETDGSSFPNGGLRETHTAAAYLSWDRGSPPFIKGDTLIIPSAFVSWKGDALDEKTPLLRSMEAIDAAGGRLLKHLGDAEATGVTCSVGWEQEFFLIDHDHFKARPDLVACGRSLFGAQPPRGQQTDANYFSRMSPRVKLVLEEAQERLFKCGVNLVIYHNEVAPSQHECSPIFTFSQVSVDQNILAMDILDEAALNHGLVALFHEKPFAGLNGSGKHSNWGVNARGTGRNLFVPGKTVEHQRSFIAFVACLLRAVKLHGDVIRAAVSSAGNDHRLGAQEAPPAIISLYLGENLGAHVQSIIDGKAELEGYGTDEKTISFGTRSVVHIPAAAEDRNRTAPFPFCGNRFELRAVGSDQNFAFAIAMVQAAFAESLDYLATKLDHGTDLTSAVREILSDNINAMFNGDGYSSEWQDKLAPARGLPNLKTTVDALEVFASDKNKEFLSRMGVFTPQEVEARQSILFSKYAEVILMEANCLMNICNNGILPACARDLASYHGMERLAGDRAAIYESLSSELAVLSNLVDAAPHNDGEHKLARYCVDVIKPQMEVLRVFIDGAERKVSKDIWPYPTYHDILFTTQYMGEGVYDEDF